MPAAGREFRGDLLAPGQNPQSWDVAREYGAGRLACIGCSRSAALLNLMPFFSLQRFLSPSHPCHNWVAARTSAQKTLATSFRFNLSSIVLTHPGWTDRGGYYPGRARRGPLCVVLCYGSCGVSQGSATRPHSGQAENGRMGLCAVDTGLVNSCAGRTSPSRWVPCVRSTRAYPPPAFPLPLAFPPPPNTVPLYPPDSLPAHPQVQVLGRADKV